MIAFLMEEQSKYHKSKYLHECSASQRFPESFEIILPYLSHFRNQGYVVWKKKAKSLRSRGHLKTYLGSYSFSVVHYT